MARPQARALAATRRATAAARRDTCARGDAASRGDGAQERQALMSTSVFVDTNVLVYAYDVSEPVKHARAREWMSRLWRDRSGRTSMQVLSEHHDTLTRKFRVNADAAWDDTVTFFAWRPLPIDESLLRRAREVQRRYQISWWDSMIVAAVF